MAAIGDLEAGEITITGFENEHVFGEARVLIRDATLSYLFLYEGN
jgi:hypothetical protein